MMEKILTYKGTDKDMKCRGMQYEIGKTEKSDDAIRCGNKGFHACEAPFDVIRYYPNINGNRFFSAESGGKIDRDQRDTKIASSEITLKAEIGFSGLVKAQIEYTRKKAESGKKGGNGSNLAGGSGSNLAGGSDSNLAGGENCVLVGDEGSRAKGKKGTMIVLLVRNDHGEIVDFKVGKIDGESLKEDVFYELVNGNFVEVKEENG